MKAALWGAAESGKKVIDLLKRYGNIEIIAIADRSKEKIGTQFLDFKIQSPEEVIAMAKNKNIDAIIFTFQNSFFKEATALFRDCIDVKGYIVPRHIQMFKDRYDSVEECLVEIDLSKPRLKQFDVNLVDHCNMKCKGCLRFSNLVESPVYADFDVMIKDWTRIKELFWGVERLKLMGGEPMLSPDLCRYIKKARQIFPDADIMITTNALLINDKCQELFDIMKENYCFFDISLYEPMEDQVDRLEEVLTRNNVWYQMNYTKGDFYKVMSRKAKYDMDAAYDNCIAKNCHHLREGKISVCSRPQYIQMMNERYGTNIPTLEGVWDIYDLDIDAWELDEKLSSPFEACKYCAPPESYVWGRADSTNAQISDWFVD